MIYFLIEFIKHCVCVRALLKNCAYQPGDSTTDFDVKGSEQAGE